MQPMYYIGLDVHKRKISYCVKDGGGQIHAEGSISATCLDLDHWRRSLQQPWSAAMEATMFTGWIYDHLKPHAAALKVAFFRVCQDNAHLKTAAKTLRVLYAPQETG